MKAILWISRKEAQPMAQLLDRPFIQHVVEQLVKRGVLCVEVFLSPEHHAVADLLGDGTRWGIEIICRRLAGNPSQQDFAAACADKAPIALFGDACCLPALPAFEGEGNSPNWPALYFHDEGHTSRWTGWALLPACTLASFGAEITAGSDWRTALKIVEVQLRKVFLEQPSMSVLSAKRIIEANSMALEGRYTGLYFAGTERQPGIWIGRGAKVPPTVFLEAPCYIGENAWIGEECRVGPGAVIGQECVVERGTSVCRSVVGEGTYLGPGLEVEDSMVVRNWVHNVRLGTEIQIDEDHVVSALSSGPLLPRWVKFTIAPLLLTAAVFLVRFL